MTTSPHSLVPGGPQAPAPSIYAGADAWAAYRAQQEIDRADLEATLIAEEKRKRKESQDAAMAALLATESNYGREELNTSAASSAPSAPTPVNAAPFSVNPLPKVFEAGGGRDIYGVNAIEGANRVNANIDKFGVKATKDANGNITLTNVGVPQGTWYQAPATAQMPQVSNDLFASIKSLQATNNPDEARGFLANIRESAANKVASLQGEAMKFAETKLGVPVLEAQLREAEAADRADPQWYPGIGDSPITAKIRGALLTTRSSVDNEAKNYLSTNTTLATMNAALKTAEAEAARITKIGDRQDRLQDESANRADAKKQANLEKADALKNSLSPTELERFMTLFPTQKAIKDPAMAALTLSEIIDRADRNEPMKIAMRATDQDLPLLAMENNPYATTLTIAKEIQLNPKADKDEIEAKLSKISSGIGSPEFIKRVLRVEGIRAGSDAAKARTAELKTTGVGLDGPGKKDLRIKQYSLALDVYKMEASDRFLDDVSKWQVNDPAFVTAQADAFKHTGKKDIESVMAAYLQNIPTDNLLPKLQLIQAAAVASAATSQKSLFGTPDTIQIQAAFAAIARKQGFWSKIGQAADTSQTFMRDLGFGDKYPLQSYVNNNDTLIDPSTGSLRQQ